MTKPHYLGFGLGLRPKHYKTILETKPDVDWFEIITEDYLIPGGNSLFYLDEIRKDYPVVMHGVSLSIGSVDALNMDYLRQVKTLAERIQAKWISDHLCWTGVNGINLHDLLPMPYTEEALAHLKTRIQQVQDFLGQRILLENPSSYLTFTADQMGEAEFLARLAKEADCYILLDINNIYVSSFNHGFSAQQYIETIPKDRVVQFHIAGHLNLKTHIIDTHDHDIIKAVYNLYEIATRRFGKISTMIERDDNIPPFAELYKELQKVKKIGMKAAETIAA